MSSLGRLESHGSFHSAFYSAVLGIGGVRVSQNPVPIKARPRWGNLLRRHRCPPIAEFISSEFISRSDLSGVCPATIAIATS